MKKVFFAIILFCLIAVQSYGQRQNWKTFHNVYGFTITLPSHFKDGGITASGIQYYNSTFFKDEVIVTVEPTEVNKTLSENYNFEISFRKNISNKHLDKDFYIISGTDDAGYYYLKGIKTKKGIFVLSINYSKEKKKAIDAILPKALQSFK